MLLCGPPGAGKTAAVYAAAQELGFHVLEVNASVARTGAQLHKVGAQLLGALSHPGCSLGLCYRFGGWGGPGADVSPCHACRWSGRRRNRVGSPALATRSGPP